MSGISSPTQNLWWEGTSGGSVASWQIYRKESNKLEQFFFVWVSIDFNYLFIFYFKMISFLHLVYGMAVSISLSGLCDNLSAGMVQLQSIINIYLIQITVY